VLVHLLASDSVKGEYFATHGNLQGTSAYIALIGHILGHANWEHLLGNFMLILLIGPILEERYGSLSLLVMILITALVSGFVDVALGKASLGASGIDFMMILIASTANIRQGEIPLTFIAVAIIYLGGEVTQAVRNDDNVSHLGHIIGGLSGAAFGFLGAKSRMPVATVSPAEPKRALPKKT